MPLGFSPVQLWSVFFIPVQSFGCNAYFYPTCFYICFILFLPFFSSIFFLLCISQQAWQCDICGSKSGKGFGEIIAFFFLDRDSFSFIASLLASYCVHELLFVDVKN